MRTMSGMSPDTEWSRRATRRCDHVGEARGSFVAICRNSEGIVLFGHIANIEQEYAFFEVS